MALYKMEQLVKMIDTEVMFFKSVNVSPWNTFQAFYRSYLLAPTRALHKQDNNNIFTTRCRIHSVRYQHTNNVMFVL